MTHWWLMSLQHMVWNCIKVLRNALGVFRNCDMYLGCCIICRQCAKCGLLAALGEATTFACKIQECLGRIGILLVVITDDVN